MSHSRWIPTIALGLVVGVPVGPARAQEAGDEHAQVLAVATAALEAITDEDMVAFTALMLPEAVTFSVAGPDGPPGRPPYSATARDDWRSRSMKVDIVERGFEPDIRIAGNVALVWMPYDLYIDGEWSHCGVDTFTMARTADGWRIAAMAWTIEQPPACRPHPEGPPG